MSDRAIDKLTDRWQAIDSMAGVGLDPNPDLIPDIIWEEVGGRENMAEGVYEFLSQIIDATAEYSVDYKVNPAFFPGPAGREAYYETFRHLKKEYPEIIRLTDGKYGEVGHTADAIAEELFGELDADGVLLNPYLGTDTIAPFTSWENKIVVVCVNTSNPSAQEVQSLQLTDGTKLWQHVLRRCVDDWNDNGNVVPVLSATHPENIVDARKIVGDMPILLAGVGSQGGSLAESVPDLLDSRGYGLMISSSRGILYAEGQPGETFAEASAVAARGLRDAINMAKRGPQ